MTMSFIETGLSSSLNVRSVTEYSVGCTRPHPLQLFPAPPPISRILQGVINSLRVESNADRKVNTAVVQHFSSGYSIGRLLVTTATNTSLITHEPAVSAPWTVSYNSLHQRSFLHRASLMDRTNTIKTLRMVALMMTKRPPLNNIIRPTIFNGRMEYSKNIGIGINRR